MMGAVDLRKFGGLTENYRNMKQGQVIILEASVFSLKNMSSRFILVCLLIFRSGDEYIWMDLNDLSR